MKHQPPSVPVLLKLLEGTPVRVVERATTLASDETRRTVRGYYDVDKKEIVVGKTASRSWGKADDVILTVIHELLHAAVPQASESWVKRKDMEYFKNPELRERVAVKLLDGLLFGGVK